MRINNKDYSTDLSNNINYQIQEKNIFVEKQGNNSVKTVFTTTGMSKIKWQTTG
jgi:hypothetical protein